MPALTRLIALAPFAVLAACATTPPPDAPVAAAAAPAAASAPADGASVYGLFLAGRGAMNAGHSDDAARFFGRVSRSEGDNPFIRQHAFWAALLAGDIQTAAAEAPTDPAAEASDRRLGVVVQGVEALAEGRAKEAHALLSGPNVGYPHRAVAALLAPWAAAAAGDMKSAGIRPLIPGDPIAQFFANLGQARLYERARRYDEAETGYKALIAVGDPGGLASFGLGAMDERRGLWDKAVEVYSAALERSPADLDLRDARARATAHRRGPPLPPIRLSAAEALMAPAASLLMQKQQDPALAYLRLALRLDPSRDEAWVLVGDILADAGDTDGARAAYLKPKPGSDHFVSARTKLAWGYQAAGDKETALRLARETLAASPGNQSAAVALADVLRADERYDESATVLDAIIATAGDQADWRLYYMRAVANEQGGRWPDAERDLQAALKIRPDEPELLNFLGYSWIERGERLSEAIDMVKKAVRLNPESGAMLDSLGWGYFRLGEYKLAVEKLEAAVVLDPADADVNDHLGDAYWRAGRKTEARFQWSRVLTLDPSAKTRTAVEAKIKGGLDASVAPARVSAAAPR